MNNPRAHPSSASRMLRLCLIGSAAFLFGCPFLQLPTEKTPEETFKTALHGTREGKRTFYEASDGFMQITGVPMDDLPCTKCHAQNYADGTPVDAATYEPSCRDCHIDPDNPEANPVTGDVCLGCHGRQGAEQQLFSDVHREAGMGCVDCHSKDEMHGDGNVYESLLVDGAIKTSCDDCHVEGGSATPPGNNTFHSIHLDKLDCSACHVKSVSSCYNCHFDTMVDEGHKRWFNQAPITGFKMLLNWKGKVHTGTFQSLSYKGQTFVALVPFFGHSITKSDISCGDCHLQNGNGNANLKQYVDTGKITVTDWDATKDGVDRLITPTGVIPITTDWRTALQFAFLDFAGATTDPIDGAANLPLWDFLKGTADGTQLKFGEPLTDEQMNALINN